MPYGGIMIRSLQEEIERRATLDQQLVFVSVDGLLKMIRPEALVLVGVDTMSTDDITRFVHLCVDTDRSLDFMIEWVDDTCVVVNFLTFEACFSARARLCGIPESSPPSLDDAEFAASLMVEQDTLSVHKTNAMDTNPDLEPFVLRLRHAHQDDKKKKNAKTYSRYYLLHGKPDRSRSHRSRLSYHVQVHDSEPDLFAHKLDPRIAKGEEPDLFADRIKRARLGSSPRGRDRPLRRDRNRLRSPMYVD